MAACGSSGHGGHGRSGWGGGGVEEIASGCQHRSIKLRSRTEASRGAVDLQALGGVPIDYHLRAVVVRAASSDASADRELVPLTKRLCVIVIIDRRNVKMGRCGPV